MGGGWSLPNYCERLVIRPVEERISDMDTGREIEPHFTSLKVLKGIWALAQRKSHDSYFTLNIKAGVAHESPESIYTWITDD